MQQTFRLNLSLWELAPKNLAWVLVRKYLRIFRLPKLGEELTIQTNPAGFHRIFTFRDYRVWDGKGELLAESGTAWILMNTETRRPARMPDWVLERFPELPALEDCLPRPLAGMPEWKAADESRSLVVGWHDLDFNLHLNNTQYWRLLLDTLPPSILSDRSPTLLRIHYASEAGLNDPIRSEHQELGDGHFLHRLIRSDNEQVLAWAESTWR